MHVKRNEVFAMGPPKPKAVPHAVAALEGGWRVSSDPVAEAPWRPPGAEAGGPGPGRRQPEEMVLAVLQGGVHLPLPSFC